MKKVEMRSSIADDVEYTYQSLYSQRRNDGRSGDAGRLLRERYSRDSYDRYLLSTFGQGLDEGTRILDIGCGDGNFVRVLKERGAYADGIDLNMGIDLEVSPFPFADCTFDVCISNHVIEHIKNPANMLFEARRILKPGGLLAIVCPNWEYCYRNFFDDPTHVRPYTAAGLRASLEISDFQNVRIDPWVVRGHALIWQMPFRFLFTGKLSPFTEKRAPAWLPWPLRSRTSSMISVGQKPR